VSTIIITFDSKEHDRLVASTGRAMRLSLGVTVAALRWRRRARTTSSRS
jgi:hypothetical protein